MSKNFSSCTITHLGTATIILEIGSLSLLTDPVLDSAGGKYSFGFGASSKKLTAPALSVESIGPIDAVLLSHNHHAMLII
jgi:L-ascorbate metabolism protein UlaG (beta-lactamase superfamily)